MAYEETEKSSDLRVSPLPETDAPLAFPLVSLAYPDLTLQRWLDYCGERLCADVTEPATGGIIAAYTRRDYLCGVAGYQVIQGVTESRILLVDLFAAISSFGGGGVYGSLLCQLARVASRMPGTAIHVAPAQSAPRQEAPGPCKHADRIVQALGEVGCAVRSGMLYKAVPLG